MNKIRRSLFFALSWFLLTTLCWAAGNVTIQQGRMSVDLKEASLVSVAKDIEKQSGITFKGDDSLLEEKVSVSFKDLPLEQGIKRILATLNYSFLFDSQGEISQVMIVSEGSVPSAPQPQLRRPPVRPAASPPPDQRRPVLRRPGATSPLVPGARTTPTPTRSRPTTSPRSSPQRPAEVTPLMQVPAESNVPEPFRTIESLPSAGGTSESEGPLHPAFRVTEPPEPAAATPKGAKEIPKAPTAQTGEKPAGEQAPREQSSQTAQ